VFSVRTGIAVSGKYGLNEVDGDVLICRYIYDEIKSKVFNVKIPFGKRIQFIIKDNSRNTQRFLDMIKGYTVMYHMQREVDDEGCLIANEYDFSCAKTLFNSQLSNAVTKLTEKERKIILFIVKKNGCTVSDIVNGINKKDGTVRNLLRGRKGQGSGGLLDKVKGLTVSRETHTMHHEDGQSITKTEDYYRIKADDGSLGFYADKFVELLPVTA
jgi:hypothetical protein